MPATLGWTAEIEEALIIPRLVKLLVFRNSADCFCETIPLQGKLSCLVNMLDDTTHGFGIQIGRVGSPTAVGAAWVHRLQFRFDEICKCVRHSYSTRCRRCQVEDRSVIGFPKTALAVASKRSLSTLAFPSHEGVRQFHAPVRRPSQHA